jgi:hypothetical protein
MAICTCTEQSDPLITQCFIDGVQTFFVKETNGHWKEVLSAKEMALYEETVACVLTPECRQRLEQV